MPILWLIFMLTCGNEDDDEDPPPKLVTWMYLSNIGRIILVYKEDWWLEFQDTTHRVRLDDIVIFLIAVTLSFIRNFASLRSMFGSWVNICNKSRTITIHVSSCLTILGNSLIIRLVSWWIVKALLTTILCNVSFMSKPYCLINYTNW